MRKSPRDAIGLLCSRQLWRPRGWRWSELERDGQIIRLWGQGYVGGNVSRIIGLGDGAKAFGSRCTYCMARQYLSMNSERRVRLAADVCEIIVMIVRLDLVFRWGKNGLYADSSIHFHSHCHGLCVTCQLLYCAGTRECVSIGLYIVSILDYPSFKRVVPPSDHASPRR